MHLHALCRNGNVVSLYKSAVYALFAMQRGVYPKKSEGQAKIHGPVGITSLKNWEEAPRIERHVIPSLRRPPAPSRRRVGRAGPPFRGGTASLGVLLLLLFVFLLEDRRGGDRIIVVKPQQAHTLRRAPRLADFVGVHADHLPVVPDDHHVGLFRHL